MITFSRTGLFFFFHRTSRTMRGPAVHAHHREFPPRAEVVESVEQVAWMLCGQFDLWPYAKIRPCCASTEWLVLSSFCLCLFTSARCADLYIALYIVDPGYQRFVSVFVRCWLCAPTTFHRSSSSTRRLGADALFRHLHWKSMSIFICGGFMYIFVSLNFKFLEGQRQFLKPKDDQ